MVSIWFGNYFQNGNGFHFVWLQFLYCLDTVSILVWIQFPIDLEAFFGLVSKSNGNGFHFGNMFLNQMETVSIKWVQFFKPVGYVMPLWILLVGIHFGLVTIGNMLSQSF